MDRFEKTEHGVNDITQYSIFDGRVEVSLTGTSFGSVEFMDPGYPSQVGRLRDNLGLPPLVQMYSSFTGTQPFAIHDFESLAHYPEKGVYATKTPFDGFVVDAAMRDRIATFQTNADCPTIVVQRDDGMLANLHGALNCIEAGDDPSIIQRAVAMMLGTHFSIQDLRVFVAAGANSCCFGHMSEDAAVQEKNLVRGEKVAAKFGRDVVGVIEKPPRNGGVSYKLFEIIRRQFDTLGLPESCFAMDDTCTSCAGLNAGRIDIPGAEGDYFSNLRQPSLAMRARGYGNRSAIVVRAKE